MYDESENACCECGSVLVRVSRECECTRTRRGRNILGARPWSLRTNASKKNIGEPLVKTPACKGMSTRSSGDAERPEDAERSSGDAERLSEDAEHSSGVAT